MVVTDTKSRGGVRRYLDSVKPEEYNPDYGEVDLSEISLRGLADLFGSDKGSIKHNYCEIYEKIIDELLSSRDRKNTKLNIVEYGVACGASLRMWSNYLPSSNIFGIDVRKECESICSNLENVEILIFDISSSDDSKFLGQKEKFDLIIDDASHISEDILDAFQNTWKYLRSGGYYVIEDMKCTYSPQYTAKFQKLFNSKAVNDRSVILKMIDSLMRYVDKRDEALEFHYYHEMLVIKKI